MKFLVVAFIFAGSNCFAVTPPSDTEQNIFVKVRSHSFVKSGKLTLGDIAEFGGFSTADTDSLKRIALGNAPEYGEKRNYSNQALTEILRAHLKRIQSKSSQHVKLQIPAEVAVEGHGQTLSRASLVKAIEDNLKKNCEDCIYKIEDVKVPEIPILAPDSIWQLRADFHKLKGTFNIAIEVINGLGEKSVYWMPGRVSIFKRVPVATHVLAIQDRLENSDYKWLDREITYLADATPDEAELPGAQIRMALAPDQIILKSHLVRKKALSRGEAVTLTAGSGGWSISLKGIAQADGFVGDFVKVLNPDTKRVVTGQVVSSGVVEVK